MRYLRMLLNCLLASSAGVLYLTALFLHLNPAVPLTPGSAAPLAAMLLLSYGVHLAVVFYAAIVLRLVLGTQVFSPGWFSVRVLAWLCACAATLGAVLMWLNLRGLRLALDDDAARGLALAAAVLTACAAGFVVLGAVRSSVGAHGGRGGAVIVSGLLVLSLVGPFWVRGGGAGSLPRVVTRDPLPAISASSSTERVLLLLLDGASLDVISTAAANGRLPHFGRLLDGGASMHLATLRPTQPGPVWTAAATGRLPSASGVRSAAAYRVVPRGPVLDLLPDHLFAHALIDLGLLEDVPHTSASVRTTTLWNILSAAGVSSGIVRWPLTYPATPIRGVLVTDVVHRVQPADAAAVAPPGPFDASQAAFPPGLAATLVQGPLDRTRASVVPAGLEAGDPLAGSMNADRLYASIADHVWDVPGLRLMAWRYEGLDAAGHAYLREAMPRAFGDVSDEEQRRFGHVLEQYYQLVDAEVGRALERLGEQDVLLVVSGFGMEPASLVKRVLERTLGNRPPSGTHERAPDGFLLAYGSHVRPGRLTRASVLDVTPTVLYYLGLPIGRDMDGYARTDVFTPAFTAERPLTFIPTYEP